MKQSGYDWRCACGWQTGRVRTVEELTAAAAAHRVFHVDQLEQIRGRATRRWNGQHYTTCPYECDCPTDQRRPS
jgi:hypothetical protein